VRDDLVEVLPAWLAARALVLLAFVVAAAVSDHVGGLGQPFRDEGLLAWDGTWYRAIATDGYEAIPMEAVRFFPLYPHTGRWLAVLPVVGVSGALVVVSNLAALGVGVALRRLVLAEGRSPEMARRAVWFSALLPSAFVFVWAYSESLMVLAAIAAIAAARRSRWGLAAAAGAVAAATRPLGLLLLVPLAWEALQVLRRDGLRAGIGPTLACLGPVAGTGAYLAWVGSAFGDPLLPFTVQEDLRGEAIDPISSLVSGLGDLVGPERFGDGLHLPFAVAILVLVVVTFKTWPTAYGLYAAAVALAALAADNLNSLERYGLNAFPIVLGLAAITEGQRTERLALAVCGSGLMALCALAWLGIYVP
jgi:hypothetical protein